MENKMESNNNLSKKSISRCPSDAETIDFIKRGTKCQAIQGFISEYSNSTSIHGLKYLGARHRPWYERILWLTIISASVYVCVILTMTTIKKWYDNPVIVSLAETSTPVWEVPFPTVTICPLAKTHRDIFNFGDFLRKYSGSVEYTEKEYEYFDTVCHVCIENSYQLFMLKFKNRFANNSPLNIFREISPGLNDTFDEISWRKNELNKYEVLHEIITEDGLCFSFNSFNNSEIFRTEYPSAKVNVTETTKKVWSLENGYSAEALVDANPLRVLAGDIDEGLNINLYANPLDADSDCSGKSQGFKVILHAPGEFPQVTKRFFRVPYKQLLLISIKPNMITTSTAVKMYDSSKRQCFFNSERYLRFFKIYTQGNCEHECIANATIEQCGCLKISMPEIPGIPYCGAGSITCYVQARTALIKNEGFKTICNCLPACTSIAYDAEITQSILNKNSVTFGNEINNDKEHDIREMSVMKIFFASNNFLSSKRSELYGIADLIANIGGLFGLFMGVSILSLIEIIYFCTIRLHANLKMRRETKLNANNENDNKNSNENDNNKDDISKIELP